MVCNDCTVDRGDEANKVSRGGTSGCVVASRLAEDPALSILIVEAGEHNEKLDAALMPGKSVHT